MAGTVENVGAWKGLGNERIDEDSVFARISPSLDIQPQQRLPIVGMQ
jgi:hypothetical protein